MSRSKIVATMTHGYAGLLPGGPYINLTASRVASTIVDAGCEVLGISDLRDQMALEIGADQCKKFAATHGVTGKELQIVKELLHIITFSAQILPEA